LRERKMSLEKRSVLLASSQPIQNPVPLQLLSQYPALDVLTAYCSLPGDKLSNGQEQITKQAFDVPMLDGYSWVRVRNYSPFPGLGKFYGLINPGLIKLVRTRDCCVVFGHAYISFWLAIMTSKIFRKPLILTTDATSLESASGGNWKVSIKRRYYSYLYKRVADLVLVPSSAAKTFLMSLGIAESRIYITPYVVDNEYIKGVAKRTDRDEVRRDWGVPADAQVAIFCAKFIPRKRPQDALRAFARANVPNSYLVMAGDGPLMDSLQREAETLGVAGRVRFLGLVKYSRLPEIYAASDVLVFTSEHEPYGLPVNEAMLCGIPAIVSDRIGAGYDLVREGETGFTYPCADVDALAAILRETLPDRALLKRLGEKARQRMETWSARENAAATVKAIEKALATKG
jgi:glycosyltransferase involved in cell wall biosynthesis